MAAAWAGRLGVRDRNKLMNGKHLGKSNQWELVLGRWKSKEDVLKHALGF